MEPDSLDDSGRGTDTESDPGGYDYGDGEEDESHDGSNSDGYDYVEGDGYDYVEGGGVNEDHDGRDGVTEFSFSDQTDTSFGN